MKKFSLALSCLSILLFFFLAESCRKDNIDNNSEWTEEEQQSYEEVMNLQDQIATDLENWFQTMDSLEAVQQAWQTFQSSDLVSEATVSSQGINVQYSNGIKGGILLEPEDYPEISDEPLPKQPSPNLTNDHKSIVNKRGYLIINPHYHERVYYANYIWSNTQGYFNNIGLFNTAFVKNDNATIDEFTKLSDYGIVHIYSHGIAWPKRDNITEVYLMTGERINHTTSKKYWSDIKGGNLPIIIGSGKGYYCVSPDFIRKNNDFSQDTTLMYGGFCYSFLGSWPDIVDDFAKGAYLGFDWSVLTNKNSDWAVHMFYYLCNRSPELPYTLQNWMNDNSRPKFYWDQKHQRNVNIHYTGDGALTLWRKSPVTLVATSPDGKPVSNPGEPGVWYPFKCEAIIGFPDLLYTWDLGDGSEKVTTDYGNVEIYWEEEGTYELKVEVNMDVDNPNTYVGSASLTVTIGENNNNIVEVVTACEHVNISLFPTTMINGMLGPLTDWRIEDIAWNGLGFTGQYNDTIYEFTKEISGSLNGDGTKVTFTAEHAYKDPWSDYEHHVIMTVTDYPFSYFIGSGADYGIGYPSSQNYVTSLSGFITNPEGETHNLSLSDLDFESIERLLLQFYNDNEPAYSPGINSERLRVFPD